MSRKHMGQLIGVATMANKKTLFVMLVGHMSIGVNFLKKCGTLLPINKITQPHPLTVFVLI